MSILISSNFKNYYKTTIDFVDYYLLDYFDKKNLDVIIVPNKVKILQKILKRKNNPNLIILPGGNDINKKDQKTLNRMTVEFKLIKYGIKKKIPILGICRGMQILNRFFNGKIKKIKGHMNTRHNIYFEKNLFGKKIINVNSFHNWGIPKNFLSNSLKAIAKDENKNIEMFKHKKFKILGVMWHPEREKSKKNFDQIINNLK